MEANKKLALLEMGIRFKNMRTVCGFTQEQMAVFLDLDRTLITRFEKGERALGMADLERACELFGCDFNVLRGLEEYRPMAVAYRARELTLEGMESVHKVQRIALNLRRIKQFGKEQDEINYTT